MTKPTRLEDVRSFPLQWPEERQRIKPGHRQRGNWSTGTFPGAVRELQDELTRASIYNWILSCDVRPHTSGGADDPACALWFNQRIRDRYALSVLASDKYDRIWHNVRAISLTIQRLRLIDEYGCYSVSQAIQGAAYLALPGPETPSARPWRAVLKVDGAEPETITDVDAHYRFLARRIGTDGTGMVELNIARDEARKELSSQGEPHA